MILHPLYEITQITVIGMLSFFFYYFGIRKDIKQPFRHGVDQ